jgi:hypothetical protein
VVEVNDTIITDTEELIALVGKYKVGDTLAVKVYRAEGLLERSANEDAPDGEYVDVEVTLEIIETDVMAEEEDPGMLFEQQK